MNQTALTLLKTEEERLRLELQSVIEAQVILTKGAKAKTRNNKKVQKAEKAPTENRRHLNFVALYQLTLEYAAINKNVTARDLSSVLGVSHTSALRCLYEAELKGKLVKTGDGVQGKPFMFNIK